jgi:hypothetical protein
MAAKDWARGRRGNQIPGSRLRDWQGLRCVALGCLSGVPVPQVALLPMKTPSSLALLVALIVAVALAGQTKTLRLASCCDPY